MLVVRQSRLAMAWTGMVAACLVLTACAGGKSVVPTISPPTATATGSSTPSLSPDPNRLVTVAGGGVELGDGGPATSASFCGPTDVAVDAEGDIYVADAGVYCSGPGGQTVRKVDPNGIITTVVGSGLHGFSGDGGPATSAQLDAPVWVAVDRAGNLYIADVHNYRIRKVDPNGIITTVAGTGEKGFSGDGGPATAAQLFGSGDFPGGMAFDAEGNLYVADGGAVRRIDTSGTITTVAGTGVTGFSGDGGPATEARVSAVDVAVDLQGNIYFGAWSSPVRRVDRDGVITTVAGGPAARAQFGAQGVPAATVPLYDPVGIAVDSHGNLFITEHHANIIRKVGLDGIITTVAGIFLPSSGGSGLFNGEEGPATEMHLNEPVGLFVDATGVLYIADTFNARIRAVYFVAVP